MFGSVLVYRHTRKVADCNFMTVGNFSGSSLNEILYSFILDFRKMMNKHTITVELSATALKLSIETGDPFVIVAVAVVALFAFVVIAK